MDTWMNLGSQDIAALSPILILFGAALIILLLESFAEQFSKNWSSSIAAIAIIIAMVAVQFAPASENPLLTSWIRFDALARFFTSLFLAIGLGSTLLAHSFFRQFEASRGEYFFLLLSALIGLILMAIAADFLTLFIGLETLSLSLYVLCDYMKKWEISHESAIKYFLIGSVASAFLVYGIALLYGAVGTTRFAGLLNAYQSLNTQPSQVLFLVGIALITLGLSFKAAIFPFHAWAPDVYAGASTPVTAFMAVGTKAGAFAAFIIIFLMALPQFNSLWNQLIAILAYPTLIYANIVALRQNQLRRFFAYSGIAHAGFLLIPLAVGTPEAIQVITFYLVVYILATLGCFATLAFLDRRQEGVVLHDLSGLFQRSPFIATVFTLCLLTLAGIPPTAGFFAKFYAFKIAFQAGYYGLVIVGLLTTILAAYYYLRLITIMLSPTTEEKDSIDFSWSATTVGILSFIGIVGLSLYATPLLEFVDFSK